MTDEMVSDNLSRKERERLRHREDILAAALRLFSRKGYHNVSMQEIAAEAEFATGTLYKFFPGKEELYTTMMRNYARKIFDALVPMLDEDIDERKKLSRFIHTHEKVFGENEQVVRLYLSETHGVGFGLPVEDYEINRFRDIGIRKLAEVIEAGIAKGIFRPIDSHHLAMMLSGAMEAMVISSEGVFGTSVTKGWASIVEDVFFQGVLNPQGETGNE
jgi:AcrR family transcriptional regulator